MSHGNDIGSFDSLLQVLTKNVEKITYLPVVAGAINKIAGRYKNKKIPNFKGTMKVHQLKNKFSVIDSPKLDFYNFSTLNPDNRIHYLGLLVYGQRKNPSTASDKNPSVILQKSSRRTRRK